MPTLPIEYDSYSYSVKPKVKRTEFTTKKTRQRMLYSTRQDVFSVSCRLDEAELVAFENFVRDDLQNGALPFDAPIFVGGEQVTQEFILLDGQYSVANIGGGLFDVSFDMQTTVTDTTVADTILADAEATGDTECTFPETQLLPAPGLYTVTASAEDSGFEASRAYEGDYVSTSRWQTPAGSLGTPSGLPLSPIWIQIDLGEPHKVDRIRLHLSLQTPDLISIEGSSNASFTSSDFGGRIQVTEDAGDVATLTPTQIYTFGPLYHRYIRINILSTSGSQDYFALGEFELWGVPYSSVPCIPPPPQFRYLLYQDDYSRFIHVPVSEEDNTSPYVAFSLPAGFYSGVTYTAINVNSVDHAFRGIQKPDGNFLFVNRDSNNSDQYVIDLNPNTGFATYLNVDFVNGDVTGYPTSQYELTGNIRNFGYDPVNNRILYEALSRVCAINLDDNSFVQVCPTQLDFRGIHDYYIHSVTNDLYVVTRNFGASNDYGFAMAQYNGSTWGEWLPLYTATTTNQNLGALTIDEEADIAYFTTKFDNRLIIFNIATNSVIDDTTHVDPIFGRASKMIIDRERGKLVLTTVAVPSVPFTISQEFGAQTYGQIWDFDLVSRELTLNNGFESGLSIGKFEYTGPELTPKMTRASWAAAVPKDGLSKMLYYTTQDTLYAYDIGTGFTSVICTRSDPYTVRRLDDPDYSGAIADPSSRFRDVIFNRDGFLYLLQERGLSSSTFVFRVDPATGARTLVYTPTVTGNNSLISEIFALAVSLDDENAILMQQENSNNVAKLDISTAGEESFVTIFGAPNLGPGDFGVNSRGIVPIWENDRFLVPATDPGDGHGAITGQFGDLTTLAGTAATGNYQNFAWNNTTESRFVSAAVHNPKSGYTDFFFRDDGTPANGKVARWQDSVWTEYSDPLDSPLYPGIADAYFTNDVHRAACSPFSDDNLMVIAQADVPDFASTKTNHALILINGSQTPDVYMQSANHTVILDYDSTTPSDDGYFGVCFGYGPPILA